MTCYQPPDTATAESYSLTEVARLIEAEQSTCQVRRIDAAGFVRRLRAAIEAHASGAYVEHGGFCKYRGRALRYVPLRTECTVMWHRRRIYRVVVARTIADRVLREGYLPLRHSRPGWAELTAYLQRRRDRRLRQLGLTPPGAEAPRSRQPHEANCDRGIPKMHVYLGRDGRPAAATAVDSNGGRWLCTAVSAVLLPWEFLTPDARIKTSALRLAEHLGVPRSVILGLIRGASTREEVAAEFAAASGREDLRCVKGEGKRRCLRP